MQRGLEIAFELDCEAMFRHQLHVGLRRSVVIGVHEPIGMLEGCVASGSFGLLPPLHVSVVEREDGAEIRILNAQWLCEAGPPASIIQPLLRTFQNPEAAVVESGARRKEDMPAEISWLPGVRT